MFQSFYKGVATYNDNLALIMYEDGIEDIVMHVEEMAMDATFSVVPAIFELHLTIFGRFGDNFLPMFHVLMTSRQGELYTAVLDRIKSQLPGLDPTIVHSDFEVAIHNAIGTVFPSARLLGCWFHHNQAVFRTIQKRGLRGEFNKPGSVFKLWVRGFFFSSPFASRQD
uniref:MULE transposase domain-containing protein n=1 Tax=Scylla olivacea TaxID=85551 RepID=A0A0P4VXE0_SCYOL